jgi:hypothetical protein
MAKATITGFIYHYQSKYSNTPSYVFSESRFSDDGDFSLVTEHSFDVEIPADFDPVPGQIAALSEKKRQLRVKLAEELATIDDRISKLSAIAYEQPVTVGVFEEIDGVF